MPLTFNLGFLVQCVDFQPGTKFRCKFKVYLDSTLSYLALCVVHYFAKSRTVDLFGFDDAVAYRYF